MLLSAISINTVENNMMMAARKRHEIYYSQLRVIYTYIHYIQMGFF